jgi:cytochrome c oxidase subunit III
MSETPMTDYSLKPSEAHVRRMHPQKFAMWLFMVSVAMIFISMSSAYIVKKGAGDWVYFRLPDMFLYTTILIVLSSVSMQWAYVSAKRNNLVGIRAGMAMTGVLGLAFVAGQWMGWQQLVEQKAYFSDAPSGSFIYVFSGLHGLHLIGGVVFLTLVLVDAFRYEVHSKRLVRMEMCTTYWHFLGGLWLYLYIFLTINN